MNRRELLSFIPAALAAAPKSQWPVGANTAVTGYELFQSISLLEKTGFGMIEIHPMGRPDSTPGKFPGFEWNTLDASTRRRLSAALRSFPHITSHLPYTGLDYMSADPAHRAHSIRTVEIAMEGSAALGAKLCVLHPQALPPADLDRRWNEYLDRFRTWADHASKLGMRLTLETMYPRSVKDFVRMIQEAGHPNLGCTIDVGHQSQYAELVARVKPEDRATPEGIRAYNDTTIDIAERLGAKVWHYHVHDIDPVTWKEHKPLIHGFVDYPRLYALLRRQNYSGLLLLEIGAPAEEMPGHLRVAKQKLERLQI
ncbi:MAG: sugar phosphate isomerase/epimerase family protein [Bryobacteraceae bacterium]